MGQVTREPAPRRIGRRDPAVLVMEWRDGVESTIPAAAIRKACPCAHCVDEHTGRPLLDPLTVPDDLCHEDVQLVGNYAISMRFGDGHSTGIFSWSLLRRIAASVE